MTTAFTCKDMKSIMIAIEKRSYPSLSAIVKDLGAIIYDAKSYVKVKYIYTSCPSQNIHEGLPKVPKVVRFRIEHST